MGRKIIGMVIILLGLVFLSGIISLVFFDVNPWNLFRSRFFPPAALDAPVQPAPAEPVPVEPAAFVPPASIRTVVVDDGLLGRRDEPAAPESQTPAFQRLAAEVKAGDLLKMAGAFAERFGSYSNQSNFSNLVDLKMFMSQKMRSWADAYVVEMRASQGDTSLYYGINTRSISQKMLLFDDEAGEAKVLIGTRRQEATGFTNNISKTFNQDIIINLVKENQSWKIDAVHWQ